MNQTTTSASIAQNPMLYAEYMRAAKHLFFIYSNNIPVLIDWQDIAHDVMAYANFEQLPIALFSYRFKIQLKRAKMQWFLYNKRMQDYYEYESTPMPDLYYSDFPCGAKTEDCIKFLYEKLQRPMTLVEVVSIMKNDDYTRRFTDITTGVNMVLAKLNPIYQKKNDRISKATSGVNNGNSVMNEERQTEAKRLFDLWGKKYTAIGREIGVAKSTVSDFIKGRSYKVAV